MDNVRELFLQTLAEVRTPQVNSFDYTPRSLADAAPTLFSSYQDAANQATILQNGDDWYYNVEPVGSKYYRIAITDDENQHVGYWTESLEERRHPKRTVKLAASHFKHRRRKKAAPAPAPIFEAKYRIYCGTTYLDTYVANDEAALKAVMTTAAVEFNMPRQMIRAVLVEDN